MWEKLKQAPAIISIIVALFQAIKDLVVMVEEEGPEDGGGKEKKNLVLQIIEIVYDLLDHWIDLPISKDTIMSVAERMIEIVVNFFNIIGAFRKKDEEDYKAEYDVAVDEEEESAKSSKFRDFMSKR